ncbi:type IV pilus secretin PilQ [Planctobacterium marinum]|uniref:Secretin n=1 Tax=Planctobacterium marinum TaxID=1631968 RepID=A0AA48HT39_9ALTE|nr:secretin [Planctobacterium marinum]
MFNKQILKPLMASLLLIFLATTTSARQSDVRLVDPNAVQSQSAMTTLVNIDFKQLEDGSGEVIFEFDKDDFQVVLAKEHRLLHLTLPGTSLGEGQLMRLNVSEFATPVEYIETFEDALQSSAVFELSEDFLHSHEKQQNRLLITINAVKEADNKSQFKAQFSGEPISLDFQDVPVRQVLQIIAQVNGFNLVTTDSVEGNVTVSLSDVPWDQALNIILRIKGLDQRMEGNILLVAPAEELAAREAQMLQSKQEAAQLAPLNTRHVQINYAKAEELALILKSPEGGVLGSRGTATVDNRTNTIIIKDTAESINEAVQMIELLDVPVRQVLIESRMVTVRDGVDEQLGVRWGFSDRQDEDGVSGSLVAADQLSAGTVPSIDDRLNVNLPVSSPAGRIGFTVARLVDGTILDLELSALETENKGEVIASPRITVANQHEAYIEQGTEIPYVQATSSGATSVEFKKAVLSMMVTPHITPDNRIILDLVVTQDTRGETVSTPTGPAVAIDTQEISTQVLVENGETIVLGGIFQQTISDADTKVPLLGDLPVLGGLFRNSQQVNDKRELLIFVTPKILTDSL